jgi:hypothetical protein
MNNLLDLTNAADKGAVCESNFQTLDASVAFGLNPSLVSGIPVAVTGPPTAGTFIAGQFWCDSASTLWLCTAGGTPGAWLRYKPTSAAVALTFGGTVNTDASMGDYFRFTAASNFTLANPTNSSDGQRVTWEIIQDPSGSHVLTLGSQFAFGTDVTGATLTTTANKRDFLTAVYCAPTSKWYIVNTVHGY